MDNSSGRSFRESVQFTNMEQLTEYIITGYIRENIACDFGFVMEILKETMHAAFIPITPMDAYTFLSGNESLCFELNRTTKRDIETLTLHNNAKCSYCYHTRGVVVFSTANGSDQCTETLEGVWNVINGSIILFGYYEQMRRYAPSTEHTPSMSTSYSQQNKLLNIDILSRLVQNSARCFDANNSSNLINLDFKQKIYDGFISKDHKLWNKMGHNTWLEMKRKAPKQYGVTRERKW